MVGSTIHMQPHLEEHPVAWHKRCKIMFHPRISTFLIARKEVRSSYNTPVNHTLDQTPASSVVVINPAMENETWETMDEHYVNLNRTAKVILRLIHV